MPFEIIADLVPIVGPALAHAAAGAFRSVAGHIENLMQGDKNKFDWGEFLGSMIRVGFLSFAYGLFGMPMGISQGAAIATDYGIYAIKNR